MPAIQTNYPLTQAAGLPGLPASMAKNNSITRNCGTVAGIPFGRGVSQGPQGEAVIGGGAKFLGVSVLDVTLIHNAAGLDRYVENENMGIQTSGEIWVIAAEAVVAGDPVYCVDADGTWYKSALAGRTLVSGAMWKTDATLGGLGIISMGIQH